jgi:hypothetical protein
MALVPCSECKKEVSDRAASCPQCGMPLAPKPGPSELAHRRRRLFVGGVVVALALGGAAKLYAMRPSDYQRTEDLRAEQDDEGPHSEHVRQRFFRLYKEHPKDAVYVYLWARCVDDAAKQLDLAQEGMRADPSFSWNYNLASRDLARLNRVPEAYDLAVKGAALDPANMPLADKTQLLKRMLDHHLESEAKPVPTAYTTYDSKENFEKGAVRYEGLFHGAVRSPERADFQAIEKTRLPSYKGPVSEVVRGFTVCANHFADACIRVYVPDDGRFEPAWQHTSTDVTRIKDEQLVRVAGAVVANGRGENILLADAVTVEAQ